MTEPVKNQDVNNSTLGRAKVAFRYGFLAVIVGLIALNLWTLARLPRPYTTDPFSNLVVSLMLLFNHIAFMFPWRRKVQVVLIGVALSWLAFGCFYLFYLGHRLFP